MPWCSILSQNCSGLSHQQENMSAEPDYFVQNCIVPSSPTGKSCTHSADKEQFFFRFVVSQQKYFGYFQGCIYIQAGQLFGPLWLQLRVLLSRNTHYPLIILASLELQSFWPKNCLAMLCQATPSCLLSSVDSCCRSQVVLYCLSNRSNSL